MILASMLGLAIDPAAPAAITILTHACQGNCPIYSARVTADGRGLFANRGEQGQTFAITAEQFRAFAAHVAPLAGVSRCGHFLGHTQPIEIIWEGADGSAIRQRYFQACLDRNVPALAPRLRDAPAMLPIQDLIRWQP